MSFERTNNGLSNAYLFHSVDFVVYVEGKYEEANNDLVSFDQYFWKSVVEVVLPNVKFKVISRGSKGNLLPIAYEVVSGKITNTLVALDRDYDFECGNDLSHARVIYTHGYSWENDIWNCDALFCLIDQLYIGDEISAGKSEEMRMCVADFLRKAKRAARINLAAKQNGMEHILLSSDIKGLVDLKKAKLPVFNRQFFTASIKKSNATRPIHMLREVNLGNEHIQGHLLAHFGYHFVCRAISKLGQKGTICFSFLSTLAINFFKKKLQDLQCDRKIYYANCFSNAIA